MESSSAVHFSKSLHFLNPLLILCTIFGMCPAVYPSDGYQAIDFVWYKIYCLLLCAVSLAATVFVMYKKSDNTLEYSIHVADSFAHFILALTCFSITVSLVFGKSKGRLLKGMFEAMRHMDEKLKYNIHLYKRKLYIGISFYILLITTYVLYDAFTWIQLLGISWYVLYLPKTIQICQFSLGMLLPMSLLSLIYWRFRAFNKTLKEYLKIKVTPTPGLNVDENHKYFFKDMCYLHTDLFVTVKNFNNIFGLVMLVGTMTAMGLIIHYIVILLVFFQFGNDLKGQTRHFVLIQCVTGMLIPLCQMLALAHVGDRVAFEAFKTSNICMMLLNKFPAYSTSESEKADVEELRALVMQCTLRKINITAKRFFPVNHTMLGFVMSSLISYIVVVMQFLSISG